MSSSNLIYKRVLKPNEELELKISQLTKLLRQAEEMTDTIKNENKGSTDDELKHHKQWVKQLKSEIKGYEKQLGTNK